MHQRVKDWLAAGIDAINVSVDSLEPMAFQMITGHNRLQQILQGIEIALASGLPSIKVNAVAMKGLNDHSLNQF